jgi:hypothetical protein
MVDQLEELVGELRGAHGDNLFSVILYGSHADGAAKRGTPGEKPRRRPSNRNILVVLDRIEPLDLRRSGPIGEKWRAAGNPLPLYISRDELAQSAEVFPAEFIDLCRARRVLAGEDPFDGFRVPRHNLKHQLEYELEGKLIRLRTLYISVSANPPRLARLMYDSLMTFAGLFRHVIRLLGHEAPFEKPQAITTLAGLLGLDLAVFDRIMGYADGAGGLSEAEATDLFSAYLTEIEKVIKAVHVCPVEAP